MKKILKDNYLYLTAFINGVVVLVIEIVGTRLIAPLYGSTIYVWSSLIVITLGALALGYYAGGKAADRFNDDRYLYNIIFVAGLSILVLPMLVKPALMASNGLGIKFGPLLASFILFTIPLTLLGMVSPFVIKLSTEKISNIGRKSGNIFAIATLGSLTGGLMSGFFLAPVIPSETLIIMTGMLLIILYIFWQLI